MTLHAIILTKWGVFAMQYDIEYVSRLEKLVEKLIPYYKEYHKLKNLPEPPLDNVIKRVNNKLPALLKKGF